jgi:hypothetical protein
MSTLRLAAALLAAAALAGCTAGDRTIETTGSTAPAPGADTPGDATAATPDAAEPVPVDARPDRFLGLSAKAVAGELGRPALIRREGPAAVWQYRPGGCVLDLVFYAKAGTRRVAHLEARDPKDAAPSPAEPCLTDLLRAQAAAKTS